MLTCILMALTLIPNKLKKSAPDAILSEAHGGRIQMISSVRRARHTLSHSLSVSVDAEVRF